MSQFLIGGMRFRFKNCVFLIFSILTNFLYVVSSSSHLSNAYRNKLVPISGNRKEERDLIFTDVAVFL